MFFQSKLPRVGTTIFTVMSTLAKEHGAINLSQGFPDFDCPEALKERVNYHLQHGKNQYVPMAGVPILRELLAQKMNTAYQANIQADTGITITAGATQAIFTTIAAFVHAKDEVIIIEPAYDCYAPAIELQGGVVVPYALKAPDFKIDWAALEQLVTARTRMIIVNTPHNPTGTTLDKEDLAQLTRITVKHDLLVLSDEVYEHLVYDGQTHQSVLQWPELRERSLATFSFGKTFHNTGWKVGYVVAPEALMTEFRKVHQFNVFSVNSFVQYGLADYLAEPAHYLELPTFYQQKRDFFAQQLADSRFQLLPCRGTYFQLADYSHISDEADFSFAKKLTKVYGVAAIPVSAFYTQQPDQRLLRFCFAKTEETLEKAARQLLKV